MFNVEVTDEMNDSQPTNPKRPGLVSAILYFAGVAALVAGVAWIAPGSGEPSAPTTLPEAAATTTPAVATEEPVVTDGEPVAAAAEVILPSVVHIRTATGLGSGVIYETDGLIVTAAHVVQGEDTVLIRLADGRQFDGTVVGTAADVDVAVIRIDATDLTAADFETDKPQVGQLAIAVGSPWNLASTVTSGIISAVDRPSCDPITFACVSVIQTDAAINPGNSGGALVDRTGRVVGINVSIFTESGANDGIGFAVPSETVMAYAESIVTGEPLVAGFLGVRGGVVTEGGRAGALITEVLPGTPADGAGIQVDDVVVSLDGMPIQGIDELAAQVRTHRPGDIVEVVLLRDGEEIVYQVTLGEQEESS